MHWLEIARNQAEERFRSLPLPGAKDENFRFTPASYQPPAGGAEAKGIQAELCALDGGEAALLVLRGGEASLTGEPGAAQFTDLQRASLPGSDWLRQSLRDRSPFPDDKFAQLACARWGNGALLHVPAGARPGKAFRFVTAPGEPESHFRHLLVLEEGAEAVVVQESWSGESAHLISELTELRLGQNSRLHWVVLQRLGGGTEAWLRQKVELAEGAELQVTALHLGGRQIQLRQETQLGARARFETRAGARGDLGQHFDFWMDVRHEGARSASSMDFRFVMADQAKAVFNGLVGVGRNARDCDASQRAKSLLLGPKASVHAIPKLLISTDAVKCSHGASVASVNPEQLHYLQSRGIPRAEAEHMIVRGFTEPVAALLPGEALRARAERGLDGKHGGVIQ